jgi:hypothetical protein
VHRRRDRTSPEYHSGAASQQGEGICQTSAITSGLTVWGDQSTSVLATAGAHPKPPSLTRWGMMFDPGSERRLAGAAGNVISVAVRARSRRWGAPSRAGGSRATATQSGVTLVAMTSHSRTAAWLT